jgi:hypothetical protein
LDPGRREVLAPQGRSSWQLGNNSLGQGVCLLQQFALLLALHHLAQGGVAGDGLCHVALQLVGLLLGTRILPLLLHLLHVI